MHMKEDAFAKYHPGVNLFFFVGAICFSVFLQHPVYLLTGTIVAMAYYLYLNGRKGLKMMAGMIPLFLFIAAFNPIINTRGKTVLFLLLGRPYTLEALVFGIAVAAVFVVMVLWFGCYNKVLTSDKCLCLMGNIMPSIALLLVMVLRMIPNLLRKAKQIGCARSSIGKGTGEAATKDKLLSGMTILGVLTSWALEGSVVSGDSMRSRGYGTAKKTSFMMYQMKKNDWILLGIMVLLASTVSCFAARGAMGVTFLPELEMASVRGANIIGFGAYVGFLLIPIVLNIKETLQWNISKYRI